MICRRAPVASRNHNGSGPWRALHNGGVTANGRRVSESTVTVTRPRPRPRRPPSANTDGRGLRGSHNVTQVTSVTHVSRLILGCTFEWHVFNWPTLTHVSKIFCQTPLPSSILFCTEIWKASYAQLPAPPTYPRIRKTWQNLCGQTGFYAMTCVRYVVLDSFIVRVAGSCAAYD